MPELPEVETIRRGLERVLIGKVIDEIKVRETRLRQRINARKLRRWVAGQKVRALHRRAKYLLFEMENDAHLVLHLGMSGRLLFCSNKLPLEKHDHIQFVFNKAQELRFRDPRRFGMIDAIPPREIHHYAPFQNLGLEPFSPQCTPAFLSNRAKGLSRPIKNFLMDSTIVVGVGNIYANEALSRAGIHPEKPCGKLRLHQWTRLVNTLHETLDLAIAAGGTTLNDFYDSNGEMGYFQQHLRVYGRDGEPCHNCGRKIRRIVQAGRSSFFCSGCQKKKA